MKLQVIDAVRERYAEIAQAVEGPDCHLAWPSGEHQLGLPYFLSSDVPDERLVIFPRDSQIGDDMNLSITATLVPREDGARYASNSATVPGTAAVGTGHNAWETSVEVSRVSADSDESCLLSLGSCPDANAEGDALHEANSSVASHVSISSVASRASLESSSSFLIPNECPMSPASPPRSAAHIAATFSPPTPDAHEARISSADMPPRTPCADRGQPGGPARGSASSVGGSGSNSVLGGAHSSPSRSPGCASASATPRKPKPPASPAAAERSATLPAGLYGAVDPRAPRTGSSLRCMIRVRLFLMAGGPRRLKRLQEEFQWTQQALESRRAYLSGRRA